MNMQRGTVYLVGAGPGDEGLLTLRGAQLLSQAQVVFYDNLVNEDLLKLAPHAEKIYVGKRGLGDKTSQSYIEDQLVLAAKKGLDVVRLKGGDPLLFGRGGEEAERLVTENIPFEIVPGVSSLIAAPAYAGIPLTHREYSSTLAFVTGQLKEDSKHPIDWVALSKMETIVMVMGVKTLRQNFEALLQAGKNPETPVAFIRWASTSKQKTYLSKLKCAADEMEELKLMPPVVTVLGEVVNLRSSLSWFEKRPLLGKQILITRASQHNSILADLLKQQGAKVHELPCIDFEESKQLHEVEVQIQQLSQYQWLVFSSAQGVNYFMRRFLSVAKDLRALSVVKIACVGPKTALALKEYHLEADYIAKEANALALAHEMLEAKLIHGKVLFVRAEQGSNDFINALQQYSVLVHLLKMYSITVSPEGRRLMAQQNINFDALDLILFASSSAVNHLLMLLDSAQKTKAFSIPCICIGEKTRKSAEQVGFKIVEQSSKSTLESLVEKAIGYLNVS